MKQKIIEHDKAFEHEIKPQIPDVELPQPTGQMNGIDVYWYAFYCPFMPMTGLASAFDELKKIIKNGLAKKKKTSIIYKTKIDETI